MTLPGDDLLLGDERRALGRAHHQPAARQALPEVVVGVAEEAHGHAPGHEGAEALPGRAGEGQRDRVVGQPGGAVAPADLRAEQRPHRAVDVGDGQGDRHRRPVGQRRARRRPGRRGPAPSRARGPAAAIWRRPMLSGTSGCASTVDRSRPGRLPVRHRGLGVEQVDPADRLVERAQAERGQQLAHLLGDVLEEGLDELGLAAELGPQRRGLGGDADRAGVEVADAHHDAARDHERRRGEAELLRPEQRADDDVAAGLELPVDLHHDPVPQPVGQQRLLGLGQADLPGDAGVLERGQAARRRCRRRGPRSAPRRSGPWPPRPPPCPTPTSATSFTCTRARGFDDLRSWISCAMSSME